MKTIGTWGNSLAIRLDTECKDLDIKHGDKVKIYTQENKIIIEKVNPEFKTNGVKFITK